MDAPRIIGRSKINDDAENAYDDRAKTKLVAQRSIEFSSGAAGTATVELFESTDNADRGGIVLRFSSVDGGNSFFAHAEQTKNGVDLHHAGDVEADSFVEALRDVLKAYRQRVSYEE